MTDLTEKAPRGGLSNRAQEVMEALNEEAAACHIWLRTQANAPAQRPWFRALRPGETAQLAAGRVGVGQLKAQAHHWNWRDLSYYLSRIAEVAKTADIPPTEFADRQQFLLVNPGLGGRLQISNIIRCAVSIYNPGDQAAAHLHTPNASRTILSEEGGFTTIEGERCMARRGDVILTPNGTWHDHGNDSDEAVVWIDVLDWPLLEFLDCIWLDDEFPGTVAKNARVQSQTVSDNFSTRRYGRGGIIPRGSQQRGIGKIASPMFHYHGADIREALEGRRDEPGDPYEGIAIRLTNPATGGPLFATLDYGAQMLRQGEATRFKRETGSVMYVVLEGRGFTEVGDRKMEWGRNDIFVVPGFQWRRHVNTGDGDVVLYTVSESALLEKIGQNYAQGRLADGSTEELEV
jgi:gentisate 1,2-dioxygenase